MGFGAINTLEQLGLPCLLFNWDILINYFIYTRYGACHSAIYTSAKWLFSHIRKDLMKKYLDREGLRKRIVDIHAISYTSGSGPASFAYLFLCMYSVFFQLRYTYNLQYDM